MRIKTRFIIYGFVGLILALSTSVVVLAQDREQYVISAKAGGVNLVSGEVTLKRRGDSAWQPLTSQDALESGDLVRTGADGRVEVLLNPGSYLRVAENSEFELTNTSLDMLRVKFIKGSVIVEVAGADEARTLIEVGTPQTRVAIDRKGLYRINLLPNSATEVLVRKGRAAAGGYSSLTTELNDGKKVLVTDGSSVVANFDKKEQDSFDLWSEQRAETLIAANRRLSDRTIASSYANYRNNGFGWRRGYGSSMGLWIYDPFFRSRTFLPFYSGWSSPYGRGYSHGFGFPWHGHRYYSPFYSVPRGVYRGRVGVGIGNRQSSPVIVPRAPNRRPVPSSRHGRIHH